MPLLCCVGHAAMDHVFRIQAFPAHPGKTPAQSYRTQLGGMSANAAVAACRLGARVRFIGPVGDDDTGAYLRQALAGQGIDAAPVQVVGGAATSVSAVIVADDGERQIFNHRGAALAQAQPLDVSLLDGCDVLLTDPRWVAGAEAALRWARNSGCPAVLDGDVAPREDLARLVPLATWAVFSEAGLHTWAPSVTLQEALRQAVTEGADFAVVTRGAQGLTWMARGGDAQDLSAWPVHARDTTGAGDVFHGALGVALAQGQEPAPALRRAAAAAALTCERGLGVPGAPTQDELEQFMEHRR